MSNLLVLNGGAAVKAGNKSAYLNIPDPKTAFAKHGINTGDVLVYDAILKQINYSNIVNIQFSHAADQTLWPKQTPDMAIVRGSNYISEQVDLSHVVPLLENIKSPIVAMGIGAQAAEYKKLKLPAGTVRALKIIAEKSVSVGVRGHYSAEVLNDIGIKNIRVIGCPSFYRACKSSLKIKPLPAKDLRIGLTLNRYLSHEYASDSIKVNRTQRALIQEIAGRPSGRLYSQGEREETLVIYSEGTDRDKNLSGILGKYKLQDDAQARDLFLNRMAAFFDIESWAGDVQKNVDLMIGLRLHGNVIALHQGLPALFFTYDARIRELAALFSVPSVEIDNFLPVTLETYLKAADFTKTEQAYAANFQVYRAFLEENGLVHVLPKSSTTAKHPGTTGQLDVNFSAAELRAWYGREVAYLTSELEAIKNKAWRLEVALRQEREAKAATKP